MRTDITRSNIVEWGIEPISRIIALAWFDIVKTIRGTALGWLWLFIKPSIYILAFWFALTFGLRVGATEGSSSYILWLAAGIIPWFAMSDMLTKGCDVYTKYPYLVTRLKFSQLGISCFFCLSVVMVQIMLLVVFMVVCLACGAHFEIYVLQTPFLVLMMFAFFAVTSVLFSQLSAVCKDVRNLVRALVTPLFWFSGILFNVNALSLAWAKTILLFDPVTFFVSSYRAALCENYWIWEDPKMLFAFLSVFAATLILACISYKHWHKVVPDVL